MNTARRGNVRSGRGRGSSTNSQSYQYDVNVLASSIRTPPTSSSRKGSASPHSSSHGTQGPYKKVTLDSRFSAMNGRRSRSASRQPSRSPTPTATRTRSKSPLRPVMLRVINVEAKRDLTNFVTGAVHSILMEREYISPRVIKVAVKNAIDAWFSS